MNNVSQNSPLLKAIDIEAMPEIARAHKLNDRALRHTRSLSDAVGMSQIGVHLVRIEPGKETTQFHFHHYKEEFIYILSGRGVADIGDQRIEVGAGDFMGFTAPSLPHALKNPFDEDLVFLMGGDRGEFDVCVYPRINKQQIRIGEERQLVDW